MDRLFDVNLSTAPGWTDGETWGYCNPAQSLSGIYHRIYTESDEDDPEYRINPGDNFYIGSAPNNIQDWKPKTLPWNFDIDGTKGGEYSFYFGVQVGDSEIDTLATHAPWIINATGEVINIDADHHRFYGIKIKDSDPLFTLKTDATGITLDGIVLDNTPLVETAGYRCTDWIVRNVTAFNSTSRLMEIPALSSNVSFQNFDIVGEGDIGAIVRSGHSEFEMVGGSIVNEDNKFSEVEKAYTGLLIEQGGAVVVQHKKTQGFSGNAFTFHCEVDAHGLESTHDGAGIEFHEYATARDCLVKWTRQKTGNSFAYYFHKDGELNNSGCVLDETGGLGVIVAEEGSTITINGGDYRALLPLPFLTAQGNCTFILNQVTVNGVIYNETIELLRGEAWRGEKATVTLDPLPVYANKTLSLPWMHIPQLDDAISVQGSDRPFETQIDLPSGARIVPTKEGSIRYMPLDAWLHLDPGEMAIDYFRYSTDLLIYMHQFEIYGSNEVSSKIVQPDSFSGSGWSRQGEQYSATGTSSPLSSSGTFEAGEVYQISFKISDLQGGSLKPYFDGEVPEFSHTIEGTRNWLIRAPANTTQIKIEADNFNGTLQNIYVRKLVRTEAPPTPDLNASVSGNDVTLNFEVEPVARLRDTHTPDVYISNQELNESAQDGYRAGSSEAHKNFLFENVYSNGKRNGITLKGAESLEVSRLTVRGGYGQNLAKGETLDEDYPNSTWQVGVQADLHGPFCKIQQLTFCDIDLELESNYGNYKATFGNSDCVVVNGEYNGEESFKYSAHYYGTRFKGGSDSLSDCKKYTELVNMELEGACKQVRTHKHGAAVVANSNLIRVEGVRECFSPTHSSPYIEIWNTHVDGVPCVTIEQLKDFPAGFGTYSNYSPARINTRLVHVLNTFPTLSDYNRAAMTDMDFRYSDDNGFSWGPLDVPNTGLPGVVGWYKRVINLPSGTYQIRCRCRNGALIGAWSNEITITV